MLSSFVILQTLCSPNEDFRWRNKRWNPHFRDTFHWFVAQIEYSHPWKGPRKSGFHLLFILPKSSFGSHKLVTKERSINRTNASCGIDPRKVPPCSQSPHVGNNILCSPNEDFRTSKNTWPTRFVSTFHNPNYSIGAKSASKVLTKCLDRMFFDVPKSSFGEHKFRWLTETFDESTMSLFEELFND